MDMSLGSPVAFKHIPSSVGNDDIGDLGDLMYGQWCCFWQCAIAYVVVVRVLGSQETLSQEDERDERVGGKMHVPLAKDSKPIRVRKSWCSLYR